MLSTRVFNAKSVPYSLSKLTVLPFLPRNPSRSSKLRVNAPSSYATKPMKRKTSAKEPPAKKVRVQEPEYTDVEPRRDEGGAILWPASKDALDNAKRFIEQWYVR